MSKREPLIVEVPTTLTRIAAMCCKITGNPCGTDTWGVGADGKIIPCRCESCTEYMRSKER